MVFGNPAASAAARALYGMNGSLTFPTEMSSTNLGSILDFSRACWKSCIRRLSTGVSFKPPLNALVKGVLAAKVTTTSSGFFEVLL